MTSEPDPIGEDNPTPNSGRKTDVQPGDSNHAIHPTSGVPQLPPTEREGQITYKTEKYWWDKFKPFVEIAGILVAAVYTYYTIGMYHVNKEASDAAKLAAVTSYDQFFVARSESAAAAAAQKKALKEQERLSNKSIDANRDISRNDQRAWVGYSEIKSIKFQVGQQADYLIGIKNTGKSPALHMHTVTSGNSIPKDREDTFPYDKPGNVAPSESTLQPQAEDFLVPSSQSPVFNQEQIDAIKSGEYIMRIYGKIDYQDIFSKTHHTTFCLVLRPDLMTLGFCDRYNNAD